MKFHLGRHVPELDGEVEVFLLSAEGFFQDAADKAWTADEPWAVEPELVVGIEAGTEEGEALDVIPMDVAEEEVGVDGLGVVVE